MPQIDRPILILNNQGQTCSPFVLTQRQHILGRDPQLADLLVPPDWGVISRCQATLLEINGRYHIFDGDRRQPSRNRLFINNHLITHDLGYCLQDGDLIKIGQNFQILITLKFLASPRSSSSRSVSALNAVSVAQKSTVIGRDPGANLQLLAPTVSRKHAVLDYLEPNHYLLHDYSTNGIFVNDVKVKGKIHLNDGAIIKIAPFTLVLQNNHLAIADRGDHIRLDAQNILRVVKNKQNEEITLLNHISLPIEPGQLVALVGGSGAGKSTLMRTLLGIEPTTQGVVYLNGEDLRNNFNIYRNQIGYVPQKDIVHRELRVEEVLRYAAQLRLPADSDIDGVIDQTLEQIEMQEQREVLVKNLSGGQLKRVSIGVELLVDPKLFFLDEPTSGLDPGLDKKMMQLLRKLADQGRTIILVTHATSNINLCDRLVFLGQGGNLCYFGDFSDAAQFFALNGGDFADIYIQLDNPGAVLATASRYQQSPYQKKYIDERLAIDPSQASQAHPEQVKANFFQQTAILCQRYFQLLVRDPVSVGTTLVTAPISILLIDLAIRQKEPFVLGTEENPALAPLAQTVVFVFTCAAIWVGLASSLQEIVKENDIYLRERLVNLNLLAYLCSKVVILAGLALLQTVFMVAAIAWGFSAPESWSVSWLLGVSITSFLTLFAAMALGLMISSLVKNSTQANSALPILLLPQIIFSGVLFKTEGLISKYLSWLTISRWSVGAYGALVDINRLVPAPIQLPDGREIAPPFKITAVYDPSWHNLSLNWQLLMLHALLYSVIAFWLQKRKDVL
ncbi:ATP-binding cassette domain-containing protein [Synechocystis sp. LKSZ1]|uniref:ATP-binding cassette domain-containing protein n=1 Tax=Synechocystis sp. LKSZ1 TaxID=3144951 RepID=UPI00336BCDFA